MGGEGNVPPEIGPGAPESLDDAGLRLIEGAQAIIDTYGALAESQETEPSSDTAANDLLLRAVLPSLADGEGEWWIVDDPGIQPGEGQLSIRPAAAQIDDGSFGMLLGVVWIPTALRSAGTLSTIRDAHADYHLYMRNEKLEVLRAVPDSIARDAAGTEVRRAGTPKAVAGGDEVREVARFVDEQRRFAGRYKVS